MQLTNTPSKELLLAAMLIAIMTTGKPVTYILKHKIILYLIKQFDYIVKVNINKFYIKSKTLKISNVFT